MSLQSLFEWGQEQSKYALFIILFILLAVLGFRRAWLAMIATIIGLAFIGIFIVKPDTMIAIGQWINDSIRLGKR